MPVAAVALAVGSFVGGATAFAAATTITASVVAGAAMVGSALSIVGTVTGNAKLAKIGAVIGIAGSLGSMALNAANAGTAAAGAAGEAAADGAGAAAAGAAESAVTTLPVAAPGGIEALGDTAASAAGSSASAATNAASTSGGMLSAATENAAAQGVAGGNDLLAQSLKDSTSTFNPSAVTGQGANAFDATATATGQANTMNAFKAPTAGGMLGSIESYPGAIDAAAAANTTASGGFLGDVGAWAKANPELAKMALNGVASAAGNLAPSSKDKAMMEAYKAQAAATTAQTAALNRKALWGSGRIA